MTGYRSRAIAALVLALCLSAAGCSGAGYHPVPGGQSSSQMPEGSSGGTRGSDGGSGGGGNGM